MPLTPDDAKLVAESYKIAVENAEKLKTLREKELALLQAELDLQDDIKDKIQQNTEITQKKTNLKNAELKLESELLSMEERKLKGTQQEFEVAKALYLTEKQNVEKAREALKEEEKKVTIFEKQINAITKVGKELQAAYKSGEDAAKKFFGVTENSFSKLVKESPEKAKEFVNGFLKEAKNISNWASLASEQLTSLGKKMLDGFNIPLLGVRINGLREMITSIIQAPSEAFRQYGFLNQYTDSINSMRKSLYDAGVSEKDMHSALGELNQSLAEFSSFNKGTRDSLINTTAKLNLAGFSMKTVTDSMVNLTKVFGQLPEQANQTTIRLAALSKTLGQGTKALDDFVSLSPKLAVFGSKAVSIFEETAIAAKKLGLSTQELYNIVDQYDTLDKAANAAGEFNLALGGQFLDPLELMKSSIEEGPIAVLKELQGAFEQSGKDINALSPSMLKFYADSIKMDPQTFRKIFQQGSQGVEEYIRQQKDAEERQKSLNKIAEQTQNIFQQIQTAFNAAFADPKLINSLVGVAHKIATIAVKLSGLLGTVLKIMPIFASLFAVTKVIQFGSALAGLARAYAAITSSAKAAAAAQGVLTFLANPIVGGLAIAGAATAGYMIWNSLSSMENAPSAAGGIPNIKEEAGITPISPTESAGDVFAPGGSIITTPSGRRIQTAGDDSVTAARSSTNGFGDLSKKFDILISKMDDLASRPVHVSMNGRKVSEEIAMSNKYNPFVGNS